MTKIAVIGNCQAIMVETCIRFLTGAEVRHWSSAAIEAVYDDGEEPALKALLEPFDVVIAQSLDIGPAPKIGNVRLKAAAKRWIGIPALHFTAFHPDLTGAATLNWEPAESPLGGYHSALTVFGYRQGFSVTETVSLFRRDVLERVGFLDVWGYAKRVFDSQCAALGFPGREAFANWTRHGAFLHTVNHPKLFVIEDITRIALALAGIACRPGRCCDYIHDGLLEQVWPVYPDVAAVYGLSSSYLFRRESNPKPPKDRFPLYMDLETFIRGSFEMYDSHGRGNIRTTTVDRWLGDDDIIRALRPV